MKEILNTILDPSSQTEDFAAPLPEPYRAVALLLPPALFQAEIGTTLQLQAGNCSVDEVAARVLENFRQRTKDERLNYAGGTMNEEARELAAEWGCTPSNTCYWDCVGAAQREIDEAENIAAGA